MSEPWNLPTLVTTRGGVKPWLTEEYRAKRRLPSQAERLAALRETHRRQTGGEPIPGFDGYFASRDGRIFGLIAGSGLSTTPRELTQKPATGSGYLQVRVKGGICTHVHRLMALAFIGPRPEGLQIRHLDGNKLNNHIDNLRYGTPGENTADRFRHGTVLSGEQAPWSKYTDEQIQAAVAAVMGGRDAASVAAEIGARTSTVSSWVRARECPTRYAPTAAPKTHCPHGHEYTPTNTYVWRGHRTCRACARNHRAGRSRGDDGS